MLDLQLWGIPLLFLRVSVMLGTFFLLSLAPYMVPAGKEALLHFLITLLSKQTKLFIFPQHALLSHDSVCCVSCLEGIPTVITSLCFSSLLGDPYIHEGPIKVCRVLGDKFSLFMYSRLIFHIIFMPLKIAYLFSF